MTAKRRPCACECHKGTNLYHVRWRPCCANPIDGGKAVPVWGCTMKDDEVRYLIAKSKDEVVPFWQKEFGLIPIAESVAEVTP